MDRRYCIIGQAFDLMWPPTAANWLNVTEIGEFPARHEGEEDRRRCIRSDYFKEAGSRRCLTFREVASRVILHPFRFRPAKTLR